MAYDEELVVRVRSLLGSQSKIAEINMMGGLVFMVNGNMCCGVSDEQLMVRVSRDRHDSLIAMRNVTPVVKGNRPMIGFLKIGGDAIESDSGLKWWVDAALDHNRTLPPK